MKEKIKTGLSVLMILLLLPYVAAVFRTGSMTGTESVRLQRGLEEYVAEILPSQIPVSYEEEALKAQAVVIRTNLLIQAMEYYGCGTPAEAAGALREEDLETLGFTLYTREEQSRLWGFENQERFAARCRAAAEATADQVLAAGTEEDMTGGMEAAGTEESGQPELRDLPYHAVSAGMTRDGVLLGSEYAWLKPVECPGDLRAPDYLRIEVLELEEEPELLSRDSAGYVTELRLGTAVYGGEEFRALYGLSSSCLTAELTEEGVRIVTKGRGHGFGMSLYQANLQALDGKQYGEILDYFYPDTRCISFS